MSLARSSLRATGARRIVKYFTNATDLRTRLRGEALRSGELGGGRRADVSTVPTSFGSRLSLEAPLGARCCYPSAFGRAP
jgi:hypothetical protein